LADAAQLFEKVTLMAPRKAAGFHWLGRVCGVQAREFGPPRGVGPAWRAKKALEKAVALDPDNLEARLDLATYYREAPGIVGGSKRAALAQLEEVTRRNRYLGAIVFGDLAMTEKRYDEAERQLNSARQQQPEKAEAYYRLGLLHQRTGQFDQAFADFEKVLTLDPEDRRALFQIGKTTDISGRQLDRGQRALEAYLQCRPFYIMPKLSWAHRRLGNIYLKRGRRDAARTEYLAAVKADPNDPEAASALKQLDAQP
jgi:tetratricopeptide (TPR) repeat protein